MKKITNKAVILTAALIMALSGCGKPEEKVEKSFPNTFTGNFFEIDYPDGLNPSYTRDGASFNGDFDVKILGYRLPSTKAGVMPKDTDRLSELGLILGNFEKDTINGLTAYILDSESYIAAVFPLNGKVAVVIIANNRASLSFGKDAEKMLKSFKITKEDAFPADISAVTQQTTIPPKEEVKKDPTKKDEPKKEQKPETTTTKPRPRVQIDTTGMVAGTYYDSTMIFLKLRPGFILNNSTETSANIIGRLQGVKDQQQINIFMSPPVSVSAEKLAVQFSGGKKPVPVTMGSNTFQSIVNTLSNGGKMTFLFYCNDYYSCKIILMGSMQLTGEIREILGSIIFK